jgi:S1-C subfamily serine protease
MKEYLLVLLLAAALFCSGCVVKQVQVVCNHPYIEFGATCCLDIDSNSICDDDDRLTEELGEWEGLPEDCPVEGSQGSAAKDEAASKNTDENTRFLSLSDALQGVVIIEIVKDGKVVSYGSGFFISPEGYILTNTHVVDEYDPTQVMFRVESYSGNEYNASLVDWSWDYDIALLKVKDKISYNLPSLEFGSVDNVMVGDEVYVLGSPMGLDFSITKGILSGKHRSGMRDVDINDYIQMDAALNPGNSGGPIINSDGKVVGLATFGYLFLEGLNFALESDTAKRIYEVMKTEKAEVPDSSTPKCRMNTNVYFPVVSDYGFRDFDKEVSIGKPVELGVFYKEVEDKVYFNSIGLDMENRGRYTQSVCFRMRIINDAEVIFNQNLDGETAIPAKSTVAGYSVPINFKAVYSPDWFYYELTAYDCDSREKIYEFYRKDRFSIDKRKGDVEVFEKC